MQFLFLAVCGVVLAGCGPQKVAGSYRDAVKPDLRYRFGEDGSWSGELVVKVPAGVFPHGAGNRLEGTFTRSGDVLELVCTNAGRQDPISGEFMKETADLAGYSHKLLVENGALTPVGLNGEKDATFATDLNPLGVRKLVPEDKNP